jgi:hypothetical protein
VHRTLVGAPTTTLVRRPPTHFAVLPRSPEPTELPRTHLPRTRVHKDKREGQRSQAPPGPLVSLPQLPRRRYRPALAQRSLRVRHERPLGCSRWHGSARRSDLWGRCAYDGYGRAPDRAALEGASVGQGIYVYVEDVKHILPAELPERGWCTRRRIPSGGRTAIECSTLRGMSGASVPTGPAANPQCLGPCHRGGYRSPPGIIRTTGDHGYGLPRTPLLGVG